MSMTQRPPTAVRTATACRLRLHGGTENEQWIDVPPGKHSVGSGPRCQIRLQEPGVGAMECLLVCDRSSLRVRRWSDSVLLNGKSFEEATVTDGDVLTVGPLEMTIVEPSLTDSDASAGLEPDEWVESRLQTACDAIDGIFGCPSTSSSSGSPYAAWQDDRTSRPTQRIPRPAAAQTGGTATAASADSLTKAAVRRRSRRALAVIRRQRQDHDQLLARINELEQLVAQSLAEPAASQPVPTACELQDSTASEQIADFEGQIRLLQAQLGGREAELQQARYSIDALERQLIDSQHTMNAFTEERAHWEQQFNEIESRLARYVDRIQELEEQLAANQTPLAEEPAEAVAVVSETGGDWEMQFGNSADQQSLNSQAADSEVHAAPEFEREGTATAVEEESREASAGDNDWQEDVAEPATETSEADVETAVAPPDANAANSLDASEDSIDWASNLDVAEEAAEPTPKAAENANVEQALDHLRGISIWRESPGGEGNERARSSPHAESESESSREATTPVSFLDRYAHMFSEGDSVAAPLVHEDSTAPLKEAVPPPQVHTDEESVEQYMAKLLDRMRGGPAGSSTNASVPDLQPMVVKANATPVDGARDEAPLEQPKFTKIEDMKTKAAAPEQPSDMAAMRALANQSARHALSLHAARKLRRTAITRVIVTALAASVAVYLLLNAPTWRSLAFAAGCAASFAALYWGILTMGTLLKGFQLGAFDDYEEELADEMTLNPPLPIDVEQSAAEVVAVSAEPPTTSEPADEGQVPAEEAAVAE